MKIPATEENKKAFADFKDMALNACGVNIGYIEKNGKMEIKQPQPHKDPIWKLSDDGETNAAVRKAIRALVLRLYNTVVFMDDPIEYLMEKCSLKILNKTSNRWFSIDLRFGTVGFGNDKFDTAYAPLRVCGNEKIRSIIAHALESHPELFVEYLSALVVGTFDVECLDYFLKDGSMLFSNQWCMVFACVYSNPEEHKNVRISINQEECSNYVDFNITEETKNAISVMMCEKLAYLVDTKCVNDQSAANINIARAEKEIEKCKEHVEEQKRNIETANDVKKRRYEGIERYAKRFKKAE